MKKAIIIYENNGKHFSFWLDCKGIFHALHLFEVEKKLNVDCILSIDII